MTQLQEDLTLTLKSLGVPFSLGMATMLSLKTEEEQLQLARFILDNRERTPTPEEIEAKVKDILTSTP